MCVQVVWDWGLNPEGSKEARKIHTWPLSSPNPYCAEMVFLGQASTLGQGLACKARSSGPKVTSSVSPAPRVPEPGPSVECTCGCKPGVINVYLPIRGPAAWHRLWLKRAECLPTPACCCHHNVCGLDGCKAMSSGHARDSRSPGS